MYLNIVMKNRFYLLMILVLGTYMGSYAQTVFAPDLQCVQNDNVSGDITLSWTNATNTCGTFVQYTIYASSNGPDGPYNQIAVTNQAATSHVLVNYLGTSSTWHFYMESNYNCPGAVVLKSDTVDNQPPATPQIINVTVTAGNDVIFNWEPSASPQTYAYIIYYFIPNNQTALTLDTVYGRFNTTYTDIIGDPSYDSLVYTIAAFDSCGRISSFNTLPHNTIFTRLSSQACEKAIKLNWNKYNNWPQSVKEYQVWVSVNAGPFVNSGTTTETEFDFTAFNDGDSLGVFIRAISAADTTVTSDGNIVATRASIVQPPAYMYITNATVDLDNHIQVTWMVDTLAELIFYKLDRSTNAVSYQNVVQLPAPDPLNFLETYGDSSSITPQNNPYFYKVTAFDSCQGTFVTDSVKTVSLQGELYDYYIANLQWNEFELAHANVIRYRLYRNAGQGYFLIRTFTPGTTEFSDSLQQFLAESGIFCYRIEAEYQLSLPTGYTATLSSFSNEQCIIHRPIIYIPNAFAPYGVNNVFKPTIIYGNPQGYVMQIYNRFGGKIFESNDPNIGWDGTEGGKPSQLGGYGYLIQFKAEDGVNVERKGMVLLVK